MIPCQISIFNFRRLLRISRQPFYLCSYRSGDYLNFGFSSILYTLIDLEPAQNLSCLRILYTLSTWNLPGPRAICVYFIRYRPGTCLGPENLSIQAPLILAFRVSYIRCRLGDCSDPDCLRIQYTLSTRSTLGSGLFAYTAYAYRPGACSNPENLSIQAPLILAFRVSYIRCRPGARSDPGCLRIQYTLSTWSMLGSRLFAYTVYAIDLEPAQNLSCLRILHTLIDQEPARTLKI